MSAVAGVFWRNKSAEGAAVDFYRRLSQIVRVLAQKKFLTEIVRPNCLLLKCDYSAYGSSGLDSEDSESVSAICGHPYIDRLVDQPRARHLEFLTTAARDGRLQQFTEARGSFTFMRSEFCGSKQTGALILAGDCLGIRPLYYVDNGSIVVFSSTLGVIRAMGSELTGASDERGGAEMGVFGHTLGDRTGWRNVRCVPAGTALVFGSDETKHERYWSMSRVPAADRASEGDSLQEVFDHFNEAVSVRAGRPGTALATLSGGLDSRVVVASLRSLGVHVNSVNFAPPDSQDLVYGREIAEALGCNHTEIPMPSGGVLDRTTAALQILHADTEERSGRADEQNMIWSGDGGSVLMGHVYLTEEMVRAAEECEYERAVDLLIRDQSWYVPRRILRRTKSSVVTEYPRDGLLESLQNEHSSDPGRRLHMMLMATDQRHHMHPHFERIYEHRCEMQLPFFDKKVIEAVIARPVRPFLNHRFYNRWLTLFPPVVTSVPWQAYPGHEACPLSEGNGLTYQWTAQFSKASRHLDRQKYLRSTWLALKAGRYRKTAISPMRLSFALVATALRVRDLTYALRFSQAMVEQ